MLTGESGTSIRFGRHSYADVHARRPGRSIAALEFHHASLNGGT